MDITGLRLYPVASFDVNVVETSGSLVMVLFIRSKVSDFLTPALVLFL